MTDDPFLPPDDDLLPEEGGGEATPESAAPLEAPFPETAAPEDPREQIEPPPPPAPAQSRSQQGKRREERPAARGPRPDLSVAAEPLYRDSAGYRMRLEPADLARLRELHGSKGKTDQERQSERHQARPVAACATRRRPASSSRMVGVATISRPDGLWNHFMYA